MLFISSDKSISLSLIIHQNSILLGARGAGKNVCFPEDFQKFFFSLTLLNFSHHNIQLNKIATQ